MAVDQSKKEALISASELTTLIDTTIRAKYKQYPVGIFPASGANGWDKTVCSNTALSGNLTATWKCTRPNGTGAIMVGLSSTTAKSSPSFNNIDFAWYSYGDVSLNYIYESGTNVNQAGLPARNPNDTYKITYVASTGVITYYINNTVYRTVTTTTNRSFYFKIAPHYTSDSVNLCEFNHTSGNSRPFGGDFTTTVTNADQSFIVTYTSFSPSTFSLATPNQITLADLNNARSYMKTAVDYGNTLFPRQYPAASEAVTVDNYIGEMISYSNDGNKKVFGCGDTCAPACSNNCSSTCTSACYGSCTTGCSTTCSGTCSNACNNTCSSTGCTSGCSGTCTNGCTTSCTNGCQNCTGGCGGNCATGCQLLCGTTGCTGGCWSVFCSANCGFTCATTCGGTGCAASCGSACIMGGCGDNCGSKCGTGCSGGCGTNSCVSNCGGACSGSSCSNSCGQNCSTYCGTSCATGCGSSCNDSCRTACTLSCFANCQNACYSGCSTSCGSSCSGTCSGLATTSLTP